jgi:MOSC domain-containing protein YiiM
MNTGKILAICSSKRKGVPKKEISSGELVEGHGLKGDAHGGDWGRQVSLLEIEQIRVMEEKGLKVEPGAFAENITTEGFDLAAVKVGDRLSLGSSAIVEITQIGKQCHTRCAIYHRIGDCVMPEKGVFAKIIKGGSISAGDQISSMRAGPFN